LKEIPEIKEVTNGLKKTNDIVKLIHKLFFGTEGSADVRKKEVMQFNGLFADDEDKLKELIEKKKNFLKNQKYVDLIEMCRLFCLAGAAKSKGKDKYADEIISFMKEPGKVKVVVTEKAKVANVEESESEESEEKKPKTKKSKESKKATKKQVKKESKKETKKGAKKEKKEKEEKKEEKKPKATKSDKKGKKETKPKKETKK